MSLRIRFDENEDEIKVLEDEISPMLNNQHTNQVSSNQDDDDDDDEPFNPFSVPESRLAKTIWFIMYPIKIVYFITIPDCRRKSLQRFPLYFITFIMSTVYLALLTYLLVWMVVIVGKLLFREF